MNTSAYAAVVCNVQSVPVDTIEHGAHASIVVNVQEKVVGDKFAFATLVADMGELSEQSSIAPRCYVGGRAPGGTVDALGLH